MGNPEQKERKSARLKRERVNRKVRLKSADVKGDHEVGENIVLIVPPNTSTLSPIHKLIVVDLWSDDMKVVEEALKQVANLFGQENCSKENAAIIQRAGGLSTIVGTMRRWYNVPDVQVEGCVALGNATIDSKDSRLAKEAGALEAIVCAMTNYPKNRDVQSGGCFALGNLCTNAKEHGEHLVNALQGHDVILAAMKEFPNDAELHVWTCYALKWLSKWIEFRAPICDAGGRQALLYAIETHKDESKLDVQKIQKYARLALKQLLDF
jgi:hypothetical protein